MIIILIITLLLLLTFAYFRLSSLYCLGLLTLWLILINLFWSQHQILIAICGFIWLVLLIGKLVPRLRSLLISRYVYRHLKNTVPRVSNTERIALEAGETWWEAELFSGNPNWEKLLKIPPLKLTSEETSFIDNQVEALCQQLNDWEIVTQQGLTKQTWDYLKENGFFGLVIKPQYGGKGFSSYAHSCIVAKIASRSVSAAFTVMVPNSVGPAELIHLYGTDEQRAYYLPSLASGEDIPCFALTSLAAGSDAAAIQDQGLICYGEHKGKNTLGIRLNWKKRYITLAPVATLIALAVKLYDPDHLLSEQENLDITLCLVPTQLPGVQQHTKHSPMQLGFLNGPISGENVFIPLENIIGGKAGIGRGWAMLMEALAQGRGISLPALSTATAQLSYRTTSAYASIRQQFGKRLGDFPGIQAQLAKIAGLTYLCEATRRLTLMGIEQVKRPALASAISKYHLTEIARIVINMALDVHGGHALQMGPHNYLALTYQAIPIYITGEGANILTRNLLILGQGILRCHPYLYDEIKCTWDKKKGLQKFDQLLFKHIAYFAQLSVKSLIIGLTAGRWIPWQGKPALKQMGQHCTRLSIALSLIVECALLSLGKKLKLMERLSARLGDVLSYLYLVSALIKYQTDQDQEASLPFVKWGIAYCFRQAELALRSFLVNFPKRWLAVMLRFIIFPWGRTFTTPKDSLESSIAELMMKDNKERDHITNLLYINKAPNDAIGRIEMAYHTLQKIQPMMKKLNQWKAFSLQAPALILKQANEARNANIINEQEMSLLQRYAEQLRDALNVDEFPHHRSQGDV